MAIAPGTANMATFKVNLSHYMKRYGIKPVDLMRKAEINFGTIDNWRNGKLDRLEAATVLKILRFIRDNYDADAKWTDIVEFDEE
jgi:hypothetical protein